MDREGVETIESDPTKCDDEVAVSLIEMMINQSKEGSTKTFYELYYCQDGSPVFGGPNT